MVVAITVLIIIISAVRGDTSGTSEGTFGRQNGQAANENPLNHANLVLLHFVVIFYRALDTSFRLSKNQKNPLRRFARIA